MFDRAPRDPGHRMESRQSGAPSGGIRRRNHDTSNLDGQGGLAGVVPSRLEEVGDRQRLVRGEEVEDRPLAVDVVGDIPKEIMQRRVNLRPPSFASRHRFGRLRKR